GRVVDFAGLAGDRHRRPVEPGQIHRDDLVAAFPEVVEIFANRDARLAAYAVPGVVPARVERLRALRVRAGDDRLVAVDHQRLGVRRAPRLPLVRADVHLDQRRVEPEVGELPLDAARLVLTRVRLP